MEAPRLGSAREEAERLVAAGLAVASTALHGVEANRQLRGLAEQVLGADRMHDLAAGLAGFVGGLGGSEGDGPTSGSASSGFSTGSADCCVCPVCRLIAALRNPTPEFAERLASAAGDLAVGISGLLRALSGAVPRPHGAGDDPWHAATTEEPSAASAESSAAGSSAAGSSAAAAEAPAPKPVAKKAMAKKAVAKKAAAKKAAGDAVPEGTGDGAA
jgi:hypothetical protein